MKPILLLIISCILFFSSCKPEPVKPTPNPEPIKDSALKVVWKRPIGYISQKLTFVKLFNNLVVYSISANEDLGFSAIIGVDKTTGITVWFFHRFSDIQDIYQENEVLYFRSDGEIFAFSLIKGEIIWKVRAPFKFSFDGPLSLSGNKLWKSWGVNDSVVLFSISPFNGHLTKIQTWNSKKNENYGYRFRKAFIWMHPKGDSILVFTSMGTNSSYQFKSNIIAYNLTSDSIYFDFHPFQDFYSIGDPLIIGDQLIIADAESIRSIQLINPLDKRFSNYPNLYWNLRLPVSYYYCYSNLTLHNGLIMTHPNSGQGAIAWIDPVTGKIIKELHESGRTFIDFHFKDNWLFYCNWGKITKVDVNEPKIIWNFRSPSSSFSFEDDMAFDAANHLIYTMDNGNFYCFRINM